MIDFLIRLLENAICFLKRYKSHECVFIKYASTGTQVCADCGKVQQLDLTIHHQR